jgi:hypothetical protein
MSENKPNFIFIGPGRTGTSMIYEALLLHPDVCLAKNIRITNYFCTEFYKGEEWYLSFFSECQRDNVIGEMGSNYFYDILSAKRIFDLLPKVKLISILRNPYERLISSYNYKLRASLIAPEVSINEAIYSYPDLVLDNMYFDNLSGFYDKFQDENIRVLIYDDLKEDPVEFMAELYKYIGASTDFSPSIVKENINPSSLLRFDFIGSYLRNFIEWMRSNEYYSILDLLQRNIFLRSLLFKEVPAPAISSVLTESSIKYLASLYEPQIIKIENLVGRDLSSWRM